MVVRLTAEERRDLVAMLADVPDLADASGRSGVLDLAGLGKLSPHIDLSGATFAAVNRIISHLASYGRVSRDSEALGLFLNSVKLLVGLEQQHFISVLLNRHAMMVPLSDMPAIDDWHGTDAAAAVAEKIIVANTLRPIAFLSAAIRASKSIAYIDVRDGTVRWAGTGFLISPCMLLTNAHVLPRKQLLATTTFRFNYEDDEHGNPCAIADFTATADGLFEVNPALDYALVELAGRPGDRWGQLSLSTASPPPGDRVNIIQHPGGQPKQIAMQSNFVEYADDRVVQYVTATLPGSSGSPVLTDTWDVCAIHHAGGTIAQPGTGHRYFRNEGICIGQILRDLPAAIRDILGAGAGV